jgi:FAD/FMN-containing dehydrogenase
MYAVAFCEISLSTFEHTVGRMVKYYADHPEGRGSLVLIETWPNKVVTAVASDATAYPWRDAKGYVMIQFDVSNGGTVTEQAANSLGTEWRSDFAATSGYGDLAIYVNYAHGDQSVEQVYSKAKLPRLAALKKQFDPDNVCFYHQALPTEYHV